MIARLELKNFRSHKETVLDFDHQILYAAGANGVGKSSLAMAMQMALTDRCPVTDGRGKGKDRLVMTGAEDYEITVEFQDGKKLTRHLRTAVGLGTAKLTDLNDAIEREIAPMPVLTTALGGSYFGLPEDQQRDLLIGMAGAVLDKAAFEESVAQGFKALIANPAKYEGDPAKGYGTVAPHLAKLDGGSIPGLDAAHQLFYGMRTAANTTKKDRGKELETLSELGNLDFDADAQVKAGAELEAKVKLLVAQAPAPAAPTVTLPELQAQAADLEAQIKNLKPPKNLEDGIKRAQTRVEGATTKAQEQLEFRSATKSRLEALTERKRKLEALGDDAKCPTCEGDLDPARLEIVCKDLASEITQAEVALKKADTEYRGANDAKATASRRLTELEDLRDNLIPKLEALQTRIEGAQGAETPDSGADTHGEELQAARDAYNTWNETYGTRIEAARKLAKAKADYHEACDQSAAYGFMLTLIEHYKNRAVETKLADLLKTVNSWAEVFGLEFQLTANMTLTANGLHYSALSESEQIRVDTIFRLALAINTGLRFIVVDRVDVLDSKGRLGLLNLLGKLKVTALLLAKIDGELKPPPGFPRVKWLQVDKNSDMMTNVTVIPQV